MNGAANGGIAAKNAKAPAVKADASDCQLGSDKGNNSNREQERQRLSPIDVFAPWAAGEERSLRIRMHRARDIAQARACRSKHGNARQLYWQAAQIASSWVFARAPNEDLNEILATLSFMFLAAGKLERLEAPDE